MIHLLDALLSLVSGGVLLWVMQSNAALVEAPRWVRIMIGLIIVPLLFGLFDLDFDPVSPHDFAELLGKIGILGVAYWAMKREET